MPRVMPPVLAVAGAVLVVAALVLREAEPTHSVFLGIGATIMMIVGLVETAIDDQRRAQAPAPGHPGSEAPRRCSCSN